MSMQNELDKITDKIKQQRDEINLNMHLAGMEAKKEWENAETKWDDLKGKIDEITNDAKETGDEFVKGAKTISEELSLAYERIITRLKD